MISIRASSLETFSSCQRRFAAQWLIASEHDWAKDLNRTRPHIGAIVGTAAHAGVAHLLHELKRTGSHGGALRTRHAKQAAAHELHKEQSGPINFDDNGPTKTLNQGMMAAHRIVEAYHDQVRHDAEPDIVEKGLSMELNGHRVTGTMDSYLIDGTLEDLKTGVKAPKPFAQLGAYRLLLRTNEKEVGSTKVRFAQRVARNQAMPPIKAFELDAIDCENHAATIITQAGDGLARMLKTGDPYSFIANPSDMLCSAKFCPAKHTSFCPLGDMV